MKRSITAVIFIILAVIAWLASHGHKDEEMFLKFNNVDKKIEQAILHQQDGSEKKDTVIRRRKFLLNKLWRDNAAARLEREDGALIHRRILDDQEYTKQLGLKLIEEAGEVASADAQKELISELGDVLDVVECIMKHHKIEQAQVEQARDKKSKERGGTFLNREFVTVAEYWPGSFGEQYTLKDPRIVEIFD